MKNAPTLYIDNVAGLAGDMFVAACIDAGFLDVRELEKVPRSLGFNNVIVEAKKVVRSGVSATKVEVVVSPESWSGFLSGHPHIDALVHRDRTHHSHVPLKAINTILAESGLEDEAKTIAQSIFAEIARAEARAHGIDQSQVHFHEVGRIDSIVDTAMAGVCIARVAPKAVFSSPVKLGRGYIKIAHGTYPIPPPASAILSEGFKIDDLPTSLDLRDVELTTPTGLAILKTLNPTFVNEWPAGSVLTHGYGAGERDLHPLPNVTRVVLMRGDVPQRVPVALPYTRVEIVEVVCNLDDQTPERSAWVLQEALNRGALDAWITPVVGKKNRPSHMISFLVKPEDESAIVDWILRNTTSFGVRRQSWDRYQLERRMEERETRHGKLRVKVGTTIKGDVLKEKPEFEDLKRIWEKDPDFVP